MSHPLFRAEGSKPPDIGFIQVRRRGDDGWTRAPETFSAADLADTQALAARFGGGEYELVARCARNHRITARTRVTLPGQPKPLGELEPAAPNASGASRALRPALAPAHLTALLEEGRLQARVFRMFQRDSSVPDIVRATKLPSEEIRRLWGEYTTPLSSGADALERAADADDERRLTRQRLELEEKRAERAHAREQKRLELAERVVQLRELELKMARTKEAPLPSASHATEDVLESLLASLSAAARGSDPRR